MGNGEKWITCEIWWEIVKKDSRVKQLTIAEDSEINERKCASCHECTSNKINFTRKWLVILVSDPTAVADIFNTYFVNIADGIGKYIDGTIPPEDQNNKSLINMISKYASHPASWQYKSSSTMLPFPILSSYVWWCVLVTCESGSLKSHWLWQHSQQILKVGAFPLAGTLCKLTNFYITECKFPELLKFAGVLAQYKKSHMPCDENYRPVSILAALSKVFEKVHCKQMTSYFNDIFSKFLSGFRKKYGMVVNQPSFAWWKTRSLQLKQENLLELSQLI